MEHDFKKFQQYFNQFQEKRNGNVKNQDGPESLRNVSTPNAQNYPP